TAWLPAPVLRGDDRDRLPPETASRVHVVSLPFRTNGRVLYVHRRQRGVVTDRGGHRNARLQAHAHRGDGSTPRGLHLLIPGGNLGDGGGGVRGREACAGE